MRIVFAFALASAQHHQPHESDHDDVEHIKDLNTSTILVPFDAVPPYCTFAAWEVPQCVGLDSRTPDSEQHMQTRRNVVAGLVWVVAALSVFFEFTYKKVSDYAKTQGECAVEIVRTLTQEIMSVGFIALAATVLIQSGNMRLVSDMIFQQVSTHSHESGKQFSLASKPHDVRLGHQISELTVLFQDIHFFISCVVGCLVSLGCLSLYLEKRLAAKWKEAEELVYEFGSDTAAYGHLAGKKEDAALWTRYQLGKQMAYLGFRSEFLDPHEGSPPAHVHPERFDFHMYLCRCMGDAIVSSLHCPKWVYIVYFFMACAMVPFFGWSGHNAVVGFVVLAWLQLFVFYIIFRKLNWIMDQLKPSAETMESKSVGDPADPGTLAKFRGRSHTKRGESLHESLFWFGHRGPVFMGLLLQALLFGIALYIAVVVYHVQTHLHTWAAYGLWGIPLVLLPVGIILFEVYPGSLQTFVLVTSTEMLPSHRVIRLVNAAYTKQKDAFLGTVTRAIKRELTRARVRDAAHVGSLDSIEAMFDHLPEGQQNYSLHCFEAFDKRAKGGLDRGELVRCLQEIEPDEGGEHAKGVEHHGMYTDREAEDWFRILGYAHTGVMERQGFKCLVASLSGSSNEVLLESEALHLMMNHSGSASLEPDDTMLGPAQVERVLQSLSQTPPFRAAGSEIISDLLRSEGLANEGQPSSGPPSSRLEAGWGTSTGSPGRGAPQPVRLPGYKAEAAAATPRPHVPHLLGSPSHKLKRQPSRSSPTAKVSMRLLAKYVARLDAVRQNATGHAPSKSLLSRTFGRSLTRKHEERLRPAPQRGLMTQKSLPDVAR